MATASFKITSSAIAEVFKKTDALPTVWFGLDGNVVAPPLYAPECVEMLSEPRANSVITEIRLAALTALSTHSLLAMALKTPRHSAFTLRTAATESLMRMSNAIIWVEKAVLMNALSRRATSAKGNLQFALSAEMDWWNLMKSANFLELRTVMWTAGSTSAEIICASPMRNATTI